ncbi:unnamed protein product [Effrenium voratum]|nr:unnamed protein product [Effrenium voratum]
MQRSPSVQFSEAESLEAGLESRLKASRASSVSGSPTEAPSPLQLQELDAYAELVDKLRSEVARERTEREASAASLAALRNSYRLLLQRASTDSLGDPSGSGEARMAMPTSFVVH